MFFNFRESKVKTVFRKNSVMTNLLLLLSCIILLGAVGFILVKDKQEAEKVVKEVETVVSREEETQKEQPLQKKAEPKPAAVTATPMPTQTPVAVEEEVKGIVCWGDDLMTVDTTDKYSYMSVIQRLLKEKGYDIPVINKTIQGGGTLSMMKMAGVSDQVLQGYISVHQQAANGAEISIMERGIRDLTPEQTERNDLDCIPVIFMGYYGGWNHNPAELAEQQEHILKTFPNQERFLVVGTRPVDGSVDAPSLDQALQQKWGEHYISLAQTTTYPASTIEAQEIMAQTIIQKMEELGYLKK